MEPWHFRNSINPGNFEGPYREVSNLHCNKDHIFGLPIVVAPF